MEKNKLQDFLCHYGVKGMRWGVIRSKKKPRGPSSDDHKRVSALRKKSVKEMSNKELEAVNRRLQLVSTNKNLTKTRKSAGRKMVEEALLNVGKKVITNVATSQIEKRTGVDLGGKKKKKN